MGIVQRPCIAGMVRSLHHIAEVEIDRTCGAVRCGLFSCVLGKAKEFRHQIVSCCLVIQQGTQLERPIKR